MTLSSTNLSIPIRKRSLRDDVRDLLRERIVSGKLASGTRLEEIPLTAELGVSRTPLREALLGLEGEGFVRSEANKGFTVSPISADVVDETYPIVGNLESLAIRQTGARLMEVCPELRTLNERLRKNTGSRKTHYALDLRWHHLLWERCPNRRLVAMIENMKRHIRRFDGHFKRGVADVPTSCRQHDAVIHALERGDVERAARDLEKHWDDGRGIVLRWLAANSTEQGD